MDFNDLKKFFDKDKSNLNWVNELKFKEIFFIWFLLVVSFGFIYSYLNNDYSYLYNTVLGERVDNLFDSIYFSFVFATTTGFGDVTPFGIFKFIATLELITGLLVLALVTSKLVSVKQDILMDEIYELSFKNKINDLRSSLLLFRQKINQYRFITEDGLLKKRDLSDINQTIVTFNDNLKELYYILQRQNKKDCLKKMTIEDEALVLNSISNSFTRLHQFLVSLKEYTSFENELLNIQTKDVFDLLEKMIKELSFKSKKEFEEKNKEVLEFFKKITAEIEN